MSMLSLEETRTESIYPKEKSAPVIGFWKIALAVFVGNILTGLLGAFLYSLTR